MVALTSSGSSPMNAVCGTVRSPPLLLEPRFLINPGTFTRNDVLCSLKKALTKGRVGVVAVAKAAQDAGFASVHQILCGPALLQRAAVKFARGLFVALRIVIGPCRGQAAARALQRCIALAAKANQLIVRTVAMWLCHVGNCCI